MREFESGAIRDQEEDKIDYEGHISPLVLECYAKFLHKKRLLPDGTLRDADNWQKGMPKNSYIKSAFRHFMAWWKIHRGLKADETLKEALCATIFNTMGYLHEVLKEEV